MSLICRSWDPQLNVGHLIRSRLYGIARLFSLATRKALQSDSFINRDPAPAYVHEMAFYAFLCRVRRLVNTASLMDAFFNQTASSNRRAHGGEPTALSSSACSLSWSPDVMASRHRSFLPISVRGCCCSLQVSMEEFLKPFS